LSETQKGRTTETQRRHGEEREGDGMMTSSLPCPLFSRCFLCASVVHPLRRYYGLVPPGMTDRFTGARPTPAVWYTGCITRFMSRRSSDICSRALRFIPAPPSGVTAVWYTV